MALVRQPVGSVFGVALGFHQLPIRNASKDALFRALEKALDSRRFILDAEQRRVRCGDSEPIKSEPIELDDRFIADLDSGELSDGLRKVLLAQDIVLSDAIELSSDPDSGRWELHDRTNGLHLLFDRKDDSLWLSILERGDGDEPVGFVPVDEADVNTCCGLQLPPVVRPNNQKFEGDIAADIVIRRTKVGSIRISFKSEIKYELFPQVGDIAGDCPGACSDETRRIKVAVTLLGSFSAELVILGVDGVNTFFGPTTTRVDLSALQHVEPSSFDINRGDPFAQPGSPPLKAPISVNGKIIEPGDPEANRFSIKFKGSFDGFTESYGYLWTCVDNSMLELVDPPYRFGVPDEKDTGDGEPNGQTAGKPDCQQTVTFNSGRAVKIPLPSQQFVLDFNVNGQTSTIIGQFNQQGDFETTETDLTLLDRTELGGCSKDVTADMALIATHQTPRQQIGGDRLVVRSQCTVDPRVRNVDMVAQVGPGQITLALLVATRCTSRR